LGKPGAGAAAACPVGAVRGLHARSVLSALDRLLSGREQHVSNAASGDWLRRLGGVHRLDQVDGALRPAADLFGTGFSFSALSGFGFWVGFKN
jgi:hypothetical protein